MNAGPHNHGTTLRLSWRAFRDLVLEDMELRGASRRQALNVWSQDWAAFRHLFRGNPHTRHELYAEVMP